MINLRDYIGRESFFHKVERRKFSLAKSNLSEEKLMEYLSLFDANPFYKSWIQTGLSRKSVDYYAVKEMLEPLERNTQMTLKHA